MDNLFEQMTAEKARELTTRYKKDFVDSVNAWLSDTTPVSIDTIVVNEYVDLGFFYGDGFNEVGGTYSHVLENKLAYHVWADSIKVSGDTIYLPNRKKFITVKCWGEHKKQTP